MSQLPIPTRPSAGPIVPRPRPRTMVAGVLDAAAFPLRGGGKWLLSAGAIFFYGLNVLQSFMPLLGLILGILVPAYLCCYGFKIIGESARGEAVPPNWPDVDETVLPLLMYLAALAVCLLPAVVAHAWIDGVRASPGPASWTLLAVGLFVLPMALLSQALHDSFRGLNPVLVFPAIARILPAYLVMAGAFYAGLVAGGFAGAYAAGFVPVLGPLVAGGVELYVLMFEMHLLGVMYSIHAKKLAWFE
jgi:hypothetical protein